MSVLQLVNDLTGARTYQEAWNGLTQAYESLTLQNAKAAATRAITLRNDLEGSFVRREADVYDVDCWTFGGCPPSGEHELSDEWKSRLRRFAAFLESNRLPGGEYVDPDAKPSAFDALGEYQATIRWASAAVLAAVGWYLFRN